MRANSIHEASPAPLPAAFRHVSASSMRDLLREGNTQDGDAIRFAQCNETATSKNSWNKHRIFGASFSANVFASQEVRKGEIFSKFILIQ
jgi:hypothetical protein